MESEELFEYFQRNFTDIQSQFTKIQQGFTRVERGQVELKLELNRDISSLENDIVETRKNVRKISAAINDDIKTTLEALCDLQKQNTEDLIGIKDNVEEIRKVTDNLTIEHLVIKGDVKNVEVQFKSTVSENL